MNAQAKPNLPAMDLSLPRLLLRELRGVGGVVLLLAFVAVASAMSVVWSAHKTRMARAQIEQLDAARERLDADYRAMKVAQSALGEHSRVEEVAREKLQMQRVTSDTERVVQPDVPPPLAPPVKPGDPP